jgi:diguanylate cyclase (GGDEF)-like protein
MIGVRTMSSSEVPDTQAGELPARDAARLRVYGLLRSVQDGVRMPPSEIQALIDDAQQRGWPEVVRVGMFLGIVASMAEGGEPDPDGLVTLLDRAQADGDIVATALALALRAQAVNASGDPTSTVAADRDLARACVLLETAQGCSLEHASAHNECARAFGGRDLWELELEHYQAAAAALEGQRGRELVLHAILYNQAEVELNWCAALRELDETESLIERSRLARDALADADIPALPESWRRELQIFRSLLGALAQPAPEDGSPDAPAEDSYAGYLHLTRALSMQDREAALLEAETALAKIDRVECPQVHSLALCVAAEIEAQIAGRETAGLRYAKHLAQRRWVARLSSLASMQSLLHAERLRSEHALLSQHAYLDDLTRLANRRALLRFVDGLVSQAVSAVALVLIDVDHFKNVNDRYGHSVGDETLLRLAGILRGAVRAEDVAVRLGGDEFLLLLVLGNRAAARRRAETIVTWIATEDWDQIRPGMGVTASIGFSYGDPRRFDELSIAADHALYRSKAAGGNCVSD